MTNQNNGGKGVIPINPDDVLVCTAFPGLPKKLAPGQLGNVKLALALGDTVKVGFNDVVEVKGSGQKYRVDSSAVGRWCLSKR